MTAIVLVSGLGIGLGLVGIVIAITSGEPTIGSHGPASPSPRPPVPERWRTHALLPAAVIGIGVVLLTRWPVAGGFAALAVVFAPSVIGRTSSAQAIDKIEAVAAWTELLRDTLGASAGLNEAIITTAAVSPATIRYPVIRLADRISNGVPVSTALRVFASDVGDPSCDMVACALLLAASARAQRLSELLGALADSIRDEVAMRLRIEASRASSRSSVRTVVVFSFVFIGVLTVVAHSYLSPLDTAVGQLVLVAVGVCYLSGIVLMIRLVRPPKTIRILGLAGGDGSAA